MTDSAAKLYARVEIRPIVVEDEPEACQVWLVVGQQQFPVGDYMGDRAEGNFYASQLRHALSGNKQSDSSDPEAYTHPAPMPHPSGVQVGALRELAERLDAAAKRVFACAPTVVSMTPVVGKDMAEWEALFYEASDALIAATKEAP